MRFWLSFLCLGIFVTVAAGVGYLALGGGQPSPGGIEETAAGFDGEGEPATLPEVLATAHSALDEINYKVQDYCGTIVKKERIGSKLVQTVMFGKIREKPFSVYLRFVERSDNSGIKGREVIYVEGQNKGNLMVHTPGLQDATLGTMSLDPKGFLATNGERYSILDIGLANLCQQLIKRGESASDPSQVKVRRFPHARINDRQCTLMEVAYPVAEPKLWGYQARVFVDDQWHFPIRVEVYELPLDRSQGPQLIEEYTYDKLKLNNGYTDADFDSKNPQYKFP